MSKNILEIDATKNLNNIEYLFKNNNSNDDYPVQINNKNIECFNGAKKHVKDNYINKIKNIYNEKIKEETLSKYDVAAIISLFFLFFSFIYFICSNKDIKTTLYFLVSPIFLPIFIFLFSSIIYKMVPKRFITNNKNIEKIKNNEKIILDNIEYFLPMSKERLNFITKNNIKLKKYIISNPQICHSQYSIDKALGRKCAFEDYLDDDIREFFDSENSLYINTSDVDKITLNDTLLSEQANILPINDNNNDDDISMKEFKVTYAIEHGPEKSIIFKHTHEDRVEFESYINSFVEKNYNRKCNILSIKGI